MNNTVPSEVTRYVVERSLPGKIGIVRVTGPVANEPVFDLRRSSPALANSIVEAIRPPPTASLLKFAEGFAGWVGRIRPAFGRRRWNQRDHEILASLDESVLRDIGVGSRAEVPGVVAAVRSVVSAHGDNPSSVHVAVAVSRRQATNELNRGAAES